jgi:16S rRNA (guanine527-N7)-methyltransferase
MDSSHISALLRPYLGGSELTAHQLGDISTYVDLLSKWNAKMNLTAVRDPEEMVRRHFGESLFAARHLVSQDSEITAADVGSGAGFPGIPLKIFAPQLHVTLIEAHGKKATFLREVIRSLRLTNIDVFQERAEKWGRTADLVVLRAVERFASVLPIAASLVAAGGRLGLLIGQDQGPIAEQLLPGSWQNSIPIPETAKRLLQVWSKT